MRHMSFSLTTPQMLARTKTVTRRLGWSTLKPGTLLQAVEKSQGLGKGGKVRKLGVIRVLDVRDEPLSDMTTDVEYGFMECAREGFGDDPVKKWPSCFVEMFCKHMRCTPETLVTRIEFEHIAEGASP